MCPYTYTKGCILQYSHKGTIDLTREGFSRKFFLDFVFTKQKLGMFNFIIYYFKSKKYLQFELEMTEVWL